MRFAITLAIGITSTFITSKSEGATSFYVDVTNEEHNAQFHFPDGGAFHRSRDYLGAGFSAGSTWFTEPGIGAYYIADGFYSGLTQYGLWQSSWLESLHGTWDEDPHGGSGTVDILTVGGIAGAFGPDDARFGHNLPAAPPTSGDTNQHYLGIAGGPGGSEYAVWSTALTVTTTTTFTFSYSWIVAGATDANGNELGFVGAGMNAFFFVANGLDYRDGIAFSAESETQTYDGAGNQQWFTEDGEFTLEPGEYYWGMRTNGDRLSYIGVEGISIAPVPEPSGALLALAGAALMGLRRRRSS